MVLFRLVTLLASAHIGQTISIPDASRAQEVDHYDVIRSLSSDSSRRQAPTAPVMCDTNPCRRGTCVDGAQGYTCVCPEGYKGKTCIIEIGGILDIPDPSESPAPPSRSPFPSPIAFPSTSSKPSSSSQPTSAPSASPSPLPLVVGINVVIAETVTIGEGVVIGDDVVIEEDVELGNFVEVGNFVKLEKNVKTGDFVKIGIDVSEQAGYKYRRAAGDGRRRVDTIIGNNVNLQNSAAIAAGASVSRYATVGNSSIIGPATILEQYVDVGANTVVANNCTLGSFTTIGDGVAVGPLSKIDSKVIIADDVNIEEGLTIGAESTIDIKSFVGARSTIGKSVIVGSDVNVGADTVISNGATVESDVKLGTSTFVDDGYVIPYQTVGADGQQFVDDSSMSMAIIVGAAAGVLVALLVAGLAIYCVLERRKQKDIDRWTGKKEGYSIEYDIFEKEAPASVLRNIRATFEKTIPIKHLVKDQIVGSGTFGHVWRGALNYDYQEIPVAIKELRESDAQTEELLMREVDMMRRMDHPHVVYILGITKRVKGYMPCVVMEFLPLGSLHDYLVERKNQHETLPTAALLALAHQLAQGMLYLGSKNIVHRDLAARNCLLAPPTEDSHGVPILKVGDFGMSLVSEKAFAAESEAERRLSLANDYSESVQPEIKRLASTMSMKKKGKNDNLFGCVEVDTEGMSLKSSDMMNNYQDTDNSSNRRLISRTASALTKTPSLSSTGSRPPPTGGPHRLAQTQTVGMHATNDAYSQPPMGMEQPAPAQMIAGKVRQPIGTKASILAKRESCRALSRNPSSTSNTSAASDYVAVVSSPHGSPAPTRAGANSHNRPNYTNVNPGGGAEPYSSQTPQLGGPPTSNPVPNMPKRGSRLGRTVSASASPTTANELENKQPSMRRPLSVTAPDQIKSKAAGGRDLRRALSKDNLSNMQLQTGVDVEAALSEQNPGESYTRVIVCSTDSLPVRKTTAMIPSPAPRPQATLVGSMSQGQTSQSAGPTRKQLGRCQTSQPRKAPVGLGGPMPDLNAINAELNQALDEEETSVALVSYSESLLDGDVKKRASKPQDDVEGAALPLRWMAPESIATREFTAQSDVWSYGIVMWEMATLGELPYGKADVHEVVANIERGKRLERPHSCPESIYNIMRACWSELPQDRPGFDLIVELLGDILVDSLRRTMTKSSTLGMNTSMGSMGHNQDPLRRTLTNANNKMVLQHNSPGNGYTSAMSEAGSAGMTLQSVTET